MPPKPHVGYGTGPTPPEPVTAQAHAGKMWVRRTFPTGEQHDQQHLEAHIFATQPATVSAQCGRTITTGKYESVRIDVGVTLPCYLEEVDTALDHAMAIVGKFVTDEEAELRKTLSTNQA